MATVPTRIIVNTKFSDVSDTVAPNALRRLSWRSSMPLSKRMKTRVTVVKTGPTAPKSSGVTIPNTGPRKSPIRIRNSTSGTLVRLKIAANRCARKIRPPMKMMTGARFMRTVCSHQSGIDPEVRENAGGVAQADRPAPPQMGKEGVAAAALPQERAAGGGADGQERATDTGGQRDQQPLSMRH